MDKLRTKIEAEIADCQRSLKNRWEPQTYYEKLDIRIKVLEDVLHWIKEC